MEEKQGGVEANLYPVKDRLEYTLWNLVKNRSLDLIVQEFLFWNQAMNSELGASFLPCLQVVKNQRIYLVVVRRSMSLIEKLWLWSHTDVGWNCNLPFTNCMALASLNISYLIYKVRKLSNFFHAELLWELCL